jgi:hypothetical protein
MATIRSYRYKITVKKVWVVGNGQSRSSVALNQIKDFVIGCNALHRDHTCNEYVAVDQRMVDEILRNELNAGIPIYTREDWVDRYSDYADVKKLPQLPFTGKNKADQAFHWNSGPYAVLVACLKEPQEVHLLGFDLWSKTSFVNNVYKNTVNYAKHDSRRVSPDFWIYQLGKIFSHFENINFIQHQTKDWLIPKPWLAIKNLTIINDIV